MSGSPSRTVTIAPITKSSPPKSPATGIDERLISASGRARGGCELAWMTRVPPPQGDRHDHATADCRQHEPAKHRPDRSKQRHRQQRQQRVSRASARTRVAVVPQPQRNRQRNAEPNHRHGKPAEERPDRCKQREREHKQQIPAVLAGHERRDRTSHRRRRDDERRCKNQPRERRIAAHVRNQPID